MVIIDICTDPWLFVEELEEGGGIACALEPEGTAALKLEEEEEDEPGAVGIIIIMGPRLLSDEGGKVRGPEEAVLLSLLPPLLLALIDIGIPPSMPIIIIADDGCPLPAWPVIGG